MSEAPHSPLPWKIDEDGHVSDAQGKSVALNGFAYVPGIVPRHSVYRANDKLIVSAVNAHPAAEALARALEKCGMRLTSTNPLLSQTWAYSQETIETTQRLNRETLDEARAALAAYEEAK